MNWLFLILVAVPLGVYLVIILFFSGDFGESGLPREDSVAPADHAPPDVSEVAAERPDTIAQLSAGGDDLIRPLNSSMVEDSGTPPVAEPVAASVEAASLTDLTAFGLPGAGASPTLPVETPTPPQVVLEIEPLPSAEASALSDVSPTPPVRGEEQTPAPIVQTTDSHSLDTEDPEPILPEGPLVLPDKGSPKYAFDYRGRLWVEKKRKGFFRQLRRPQLPPEEPPTTSER